MQTAATAPSTSAPFTVGERVERNFDGELGTVTAVTPVAGEITAVDMDRPNPRRDENPIHERWTRVLTPTVGMPCSILLHTDTTAAVVVRVNAKSVSVRRVETGPDRHASHCECANCGVTGGNPFPIVVRDGLTDQPVGPLQRFPMVREGRYRSGSIGLRLGASVDLTDYRY